MATLAEGKRLDMLSSRQKSQLEKTGSFKTSSGTLYTPTDMDMAATASRGGKDLQALSTFMSANPDMTVPQTATPPTVDATTIGTPALTAPTPPKNAIATKLAQIESQALALKETIDQRAAAEAEGTTAAPGGLTGGDTSTGTPTGMPAAPGGSFAEMGDQALQQYLTQAMGGFELSPEAQQLQTESAQANLAAKNMANDLVAYATSTREEIMRMRQNPEGKSMGAMQAGIANYEYDRYNGKDGYADMAIAAQYALNNAEYAYEIANNAVSAERDQFDSQLQMFKDIFTMSRNDMTQSEQMQYQSMLRMHENTVNNLADAKMAAMKMAQTNGAPEDVILGIKNATTPEEVWQASGSWGTVDMLDQEYKQIRNAIAAQEYDMMLMEFNGIGDTTLSDEDRAAISKMPEAKSAQTLMTLNANLSRLQQLYKEHGTYNPLNREAAKRIQSLRAQLEIDIAVAGGQGAISEQEADRYSNMVGGNMFETGTGAANRIDEAINANNTKINNNIKYIEAVYPNVRAFDPFTDYLNKRMAEDYIEFQLNPTQDGGDYVDAYLGTFNTTTQALP